MGKIGKKEHEYYPLVMETFEEEFRAKGFHVDFEITGHPPRQNIPERFLRNNPILLDYQRALPAPDIMGLIWIADKNRKELVIVEFKKKFTFTDIFQTKGYDELFNPDHSYLVGLRPLSESSKSGNTMAFVRNNPNLLLTKQGLSKIIIRFLNEGRDGTVTLGVLGSERELW